jgi:hypothetical protein
MSLLNKENKQNTIHLNFDVYVTLIGEFEINLKEFITSEITMFIKENILQVISNRKYATEQLGDIWKRFTDYGEGEFDLDYNLPNIGRISFTLVQRFPNAIYFSSLVSITIDTNDDEIYEMFIDLLHHKECRY